MSTSVPDPLTDKWNELRGEYSVDNVCVDADPSVALSPATLQRVKDAYDQNQSAGHLRLAKAYTRLLQDRKKKLEEEVETVAHKRGLWEMQRAEVHREPLQEAAGGASEVFGQNLELLHEFASLRYDDLSKVTGISRSTVYKMSRERTTPTLSSVIQVAISFGLHVSVLLADTRTLRAWERVVSPPGPTKFQEKAVEDTAETMDRRLNGAEDDELFDPGEWLTIVESISRRVAHVFPSPGGIFGTVIGRHHGGDKGALLGGYMGHRLRAAVERENLGGFRFPGPFLESRLKKRLQDEYWGEDDGPIL